MNLHFTFRKIGSSNGIKEHTMKKVEKLEKYINYPADLYVTLSLEKNYHCAEVVCYAEFHQLVAVAKTKDLYEAVDMVFHKLESQLKKQRERRKGHKSARHAARPSSLKLGSDLGTQIPHKEKRKTI